MIDLLKCLGQLKLTAYKDNEKVYDKPVDFDTIDLLTKRFNSRLVGYWDLYYLLERQRGRSILETIHNAKFSFTGQSIDNCFIINYFRSI